MATAKKAPAKKAPAKRPASTSVATRVDALEREVAELKTQLGNIAQFIAHGIAQQLQAQLMANPDASAQLAALATHGNQR